METYINGSTTTLNFEEVVRPIDFKMWTSVIIFALYIDIVNLDGQIDTISRQNQKDFLADNNSCISLVYFL